ncbi:glycerophosphodiester phosphodiesterase [Idiomarina tyrosinivorans]|uniref:Glycerophosphodiester phosphodiesterase n=1 Tax=Idiomarina tyrosinivorans TaxID=1445662 RepID=A0A432ZF55_9GAMM|nr:glycerophosphodiester phosphodiesterase family protein [Idiomarina tyrosinivorans]RUO76596.1 glycerophosphodiester phosphodiesterase [Idiomarina tyrosinivorans]
MIIWAHRGASFEAPENTLAAFSRALDAGADGIELDVFAVDGERFVFHDRYLERLTATAGRLQDLTADQIRQLKVFGQQTIPTLRETLAHIAGRCLVNIELKGDVPAADLLSDVQYGIEHCQFSWSQLLVSSFNHHWLKRIKQQCPQLSIGALTTCCPLDYCEFAERLQATSVHIDVGFITPELVADGHQRGLKVYVFTVDEAHDIEELHALGVDGIFTNHPNHTKNVLAGLPTRPDETLLHLR